MGFLANWNYRLTAIGTAVATIAAIASAWNTYQVNQLNARDKTEEESYKFAKEFLTHIESSLKDSPRSRQMAVAALNIIAQASSNQDAKSNPVDRKALPVIMALFLNDSGSIAALDSHLNCLDQWIDFARWDEDDRTRVTAIRALGSIARGASREQDVPRLEKCVSLMAELSKLIEESKTSDSSPEENANTPLDANALALRVAIQQARSDAFTAMVKLKVFLFDPKKQSVAKNAENSPASAVKIALDDAVAQLQSIQPKLQIIKQDAVAASSTTSGSEKLKTTIEQSQAAATLALSDVRKQKISPESKGTTAPSPAPSSSVAPTATNADEPNLATVQDLIGKLANPDENVRHKARSDLALFGQDAVKPLLEAVSKPPLNEKLRLGVAMALSQMQQPIVLPDESDAGIVVNFLTSSDPPTRQAAAEFLMNLENAETLAKCFRAISALVKNRKQPETDGHAVLNACLVLGTWVRVLNDDILSPSENKPMNQIARKAVENFRTDLTNQNPKGWAKTIRTIDELLQRADQQKRKTAANESVLPPPMEILVFLGSASGSELTASNLEASVKERAFSLFNKLRDAST
jgi:hypothetical protein